MTVNLNFAVMQTKLVEWPEKFSKELEMTLPNLMKDDREIKNALREFKDRFKGLKTGGVFEDTKKVYGPTGVDLSGQEWKSETAEIFRIQQIWREKYSPKSVLTPPTSLSPAIQPQAPKPLQASRFSRIYSTCKSYFALGLKKINTAVLSILKFLHLTADPKK